MPSGDWYWCLDHQAAEVAGGDCPPDRRLGPYPSQAAAQHWKSQVESRNQTWDAADDEWDNAEPGD